MITGNKPQEHLINILKDTREHHPNFTLFLGAGASVTSGVKLSNDMIAEWRSKYYSMYGKGRDISEFFGQCSWYNRPEEYSTLFEMLFDQPSQRREYIETCLKDARPSWGYIYLVNLIRKHVFNAVFTSNFDDLLNEACYLFSSDVRPLVCAHDSSIQSLRITSARPKIIKLHGDFLFDNIKNTIRELESLEDNMRDKFKQYASEFGLIVVGYSGNDRSIMDILNTLLRSDENFPHGVYWLILHGAEISEGIMHLRRFPKFHIIEILGFDEFFAEVNDTLQLELQPEMIDPYGALAIRLNSLLENVKTSDPNRTHRVIERDIERLGNQISKISKEAQSIPQGVDKTLDLTFKEGSKTLTISVPYQLLAQVAHRKGKSDYAMQLIMKQIESQPNTFTFLMAFEILKDKWNDKIAKEIMDHFRRSSDIIAKDANMTLSCGVSLIEAQKYDLAEEVLDAGYNYYKKANGEIDFLVNYYKINKAQIKRHQKFSLTDNEMAEMRQIIESTTNSVEKLGALIVLGENTEAGKILQNLPSDGLPYGHSLRSIMNWPIIKLLPNDITGPVMKRLEDEDKNRKMALQ